MIAPGRRGTGCRESSHRKICSGHKGQGRFPRLPDEKLGKIRAEEVKGVGNQGGACRMGKETVRLKATQPAGVSGEPLRARKGGAGVTDGRLGAVYGTRSLEVLVGGLLGASS